ncbi:SURF1 family cytochrome oxidase biogenesis protein [Streptomyces stelliscabiei]|uniref:SURF1-like protein n=1 Tax=Streptomyces stelliscabiei TaxID=146820 RepID=A0A8I0P6B9_9ACTN|nr:SURF1 family protein [Streptomyces stelliscabiei]KND44942.1 membrane protein [Streptomyces stelliscabiei]MBE1596088.1 cytochrome oxidase assembly protein ShyY1 [Streptomyces stelliscabiei]MDX2519770.1 SURF1 family protein [Streptomyces stelliscabiei]MDX2556615.1 SURF1 family protein [Streptomyces stelliscabiei]MDX2615618.1 SURF1 family protein [Streptomyces stelliscabiei]
MYRFLLSRQWVILTLLSLVLIPTMVRLGIWQMHRYEERSARNQLVADALAAKPVPVERLTSPGHAVTSAERYRTVTAKGRFDTDDEVVVRRRVNADDEVGFHVLTPFVLDDGKVLLVNRGWIPADGPSQTAFPKIPAPAAGEITVTGRLMPDETTEASGIKDLQGLPDRQIMLIDSEREADRLGVRVLGGYLVQTAPEPNGDTPEQLGSPGDENAALNYAYALQWWLFALGVPIGFVILVRRERRDRAEAATAAAEERETASAPA